MEVIRYQTHLRKSIHDQIIKEISMAINKMDKEMKLSKGKDHQPK